LGEDDPDLVCRADFPGGGLYAANSSVTFSNAFITGNRAPYYEGAGACFEYHNTVLVFYTEIALNAGGYGGGIYVAGNASGPFLFELVSIVSNTAGYSGGGMSWRSSAPLRMYDSTIRDNRATNDPVIGAHGGGLISLSGDGVLTRTLVTRNAADTDGGGIEVQAGTLTLADSSLGYNHADFNANGDGRGGGLYIYDGAANMLASDQGCTFCGNSAHQGGAIAVRYGDTALVIYAPGYHQCVFAHNSAANQGGALYLQYCRARCQGNLLFDANTSVWGGAVCATGSACFVAAPVGNHRPVFTRNIAAMGGGALFLAGTSTGVLTDTTFGLPDAGNHVVTDHYLTRGGGGVAACEGSLIDAVNCRFFHNSSVTIGGALGLLNSRLVLRGQFDEPGAGVLPPNLFFGNTAKSRGAAVSLVSSTENLIADAAFISNRSTASSILDQYHADALIYNSLMVHNSATNTGAALVEFLFSSTGTFVNCTIADNLNSGITSHDGQNRIVLTNCIVWGHPGAQVEAGHSVCYSDVQGGYPTGPGNISSNPLFASAAALDYRLTYGSPCINAGFPCAWLTNDCSGEKRPQLGTWAWDMGAYEFIPEPVAAMAACALLWSLRTRAAITGTQ
jgi:predicted outer membrane repeat protein